jgi:uncharacterized protein (DUF488 family)
MAGNLPTDGGMVTQKTSMHEVLTIRTIGHSTLALDEFIERLTAHGITLVVDVRRFAGSKKFPHFNREVIEAALAHSGIEYLWLGNLLGGYRTGGYAAFTETAAFRQGLDRLLRAAARHNTAIMCAEGAWFRCHRRYVADQLVRKGHTVLHITSKKAASRHPTGTASASGDTS